MNINIEHPIIKYAEEGKPFQYDKLFYATLDKYIMEFKGARLDHLTEKDASVCLAKIIKRMEVNDIPVQQFFKEDLDSWKNFSNHTRVMKMIDLMAKDIFACFDPNRYDENGEFLRLDRLYCLNDNGFRDYIVCDAYVKTGLFKKEPLPETLYFEDLMERNKRGALPKTKNG